LVGATHKLAFGGAGRADEEQVLTADGSQQQQANLRLPLH
jgi:hypothetical protein